MTSYSTKLVTFPGFRVYRLSGNKPLGGLKIRRGCKTCHKYQRTRKAKQLETSKKGDGPSRGAYHGPGRGLEAGLKTNSDDHELLKNAHRILQL